MTAPTMTDVPTGSDALGSALEVANLFRCRLRATGDDARRRDFETWLEESILAAAQTNLNEIACKLMGDIVLHYHDEDAASRLRSVLRNSAQYFLDAGNTGEDSPPELDSSDTREPEADRLSQLPPARRLKEVSGLDVAQLASLCGVSRVTFHQWMKGGNLRGEKLARLLEISTLIEDAAASSNIGTVNIWLQTPVEPSGPTPLGLLERGRYQAFIGFVHRRPIEQRLMRKAIARPHRTPVRELPGAVESIATKAWDEGER